MLGYTAKSRKFEKSINIPQNTKTLRWKVLSKAIVHWCSQIFCKFPEKHLCWSPFLINFIKSRFQHRFFSCEVCKVFKNTFFIEHLLRWLLLHSLRTLSILTLRILILIATKRLYVAATYLFLNCSFILVCGMSFSDWWDRTMFTLTTLEC